jgi:hypothetical protein
MSDHVIYFTASQADAQLIHSVIGALAELRRSEVRRLTIAARHGIVTVSGRVHRVYTKITVLKCVRQVAGVRIIIDNIRVGLDEMSWRVRRAAVWLFVMATPLNELSENVAQQWSKMEVEASSASVASHPP